MKKKKLININKFSLSINLKQKDLQLHRYEHYKYIYRCIRTYLCTCIYICV